MIACGGFGRPGYSEDLAMLNESVMTALRGATTATLTTVLLKKGLRNVWIRNARPLRDL